MISDEQGRDEALKAMNAILGRVGWRFVGTKVRGLAVVEYEIERIADKRRATHRRWMHEIVESTMVDETVAEVADLPVSLTLASMLYMLAKQENTRVPVAG